VAADAYTAPGPVLWYEPYHPVTQLNPAVSVQGEAPLTAAGKGPGKASKFRVWGE
jgi:hypothetical protein